MRLLHALAALGLLTGPVLAQFNAHEWVGVDRLAPRYWHEAAAKPALFAKRDGSCSEDYHPCMPIAISHV